MSSVFILLLLNCPIQLLWRTFNLSCLIHDKAEINISDYGRRYMMLIRKRNCKHCYNTSTIFDNKYWFDCQKIKDMLSTYFARILRRYGVYYNNTCHGKIDTFQKYLESYDDYWN